MRAPLVPLALILLTLPSAAALGVPVANPLELATGGALGEAETAADATLASMELPLVVAIERPWASSHPMRERGLPPPDERLERGVTAPLTPHTRVEPRLLPLPPLTTGAPRGGDDATPARLAPQEGPAPSTAPPVVASRADAPGAPRRAPDLPAAAATTGILLVALALYHRFRGGALAQQGTRARVLALLRERPGLGTTEAARELGLDPTTVSYHLRRLAKERLVVTEGKGRCARHFASGSLAAPERVRILAERTSPQVLAAIRDAPGAPTASLAARVDIARTTLRWHLASLERAGLVRCERDGARVRVFPVFRKEAFS